MPASKAKKASDDRMRLRLMNQAANWEPSYEEQAAVAESSFDRLNRALLIPIERIAPMKDNPRQNFSKLDELADSIEAEGIIQPLIVRRDPDRAGYYMTVAGARRVMAANILRGHDDPEVRARVAELPCLVIDESDDRALAKALAENLAREDLTRSEMMEAVVRLERDYGWSGNRISKAISRSQGDVAELLRVAKDPELSSLVRSDLISTSAAGEITRLPQERRSAVVDEVRAGRLRTVDEIKALNPGRRRSSRPRPTVTADGRVNEFINSGEPVGDALGVNEFINPTKQDKARATTDSPINTPEGDRLPPPAARETRSRKEKISPAEKRAEEVRQAKAHAVGLRAIVEPHPLIAWDEEVRPDLDAVYEARAKLSASARADEPLSEEDAVAWAEKVFAELVAFQQRSGSVERCTRVQATLAKIGDLINGMVV